MVLSLRIKAIWSQRKHQIIAGCIAVLYSVGGGGWKFARRGIMPLLIVMTILKKEVGKAILATILLAFPLWLGYDKMTQMEIWWQMALLGALMGLGWIIIARTRVWAYMLFMALVFPLSVYLSHYQGWDWGDAEWVVGVGYAVLYLITRRRYASLS